MNEPTGQVGPYKRVGYEDPVVRRILRDPLGPEEIERLTKLAEHPELADPLIATLPERQFDIKVEEALREQTRTELRQIHAEERQTAIGGQISLVVWAA